MSQPTFQTEQLRTLWTGLERNRERVIGIASGLTKDQLAWRPGLDKWSVLECIDHLATTAMACLPYWERAIVAGAERAGPRAERPIVPGPFGRRFIRSLSPTTSKKYRTSRVFVPGTTLDSIAVIAKYREAHEGIGRTMAAADEFNLAKIVARSAATPLLRFNLATWFIATAAHEERHLNQMKRVVEHPQFPSSRSS